EVVVDEDRHELIAGRLHAGRVPRPPGDDHALAGREGARAAVEVLDHPGLGRVGQIGSRQRPGRLVPDGDGDDEVLRLADDSSRRPAGRAADRGAAAEHQQRGAEAQRAHRPRTSYTSTSSSLPLTFIAPSDFASTTSRTASYVRRVRRMEPGLARSCRREATLTLSPMTVYSMRSSVPTVPATTSPRLTPIPTSNGSWP